MGERLVRRPLGTILFLALLSMVLVACGRGKDTAHDGKGEVQKAVAIMHPTSGSDASGVVYFYKDKEGLRVKAEMEGLTPGLHGFHIHEYGDCTHVAGASAGGHFNPRNMPHGAPDAARRHAGDLGNLEADESGLAVYERTDSLLTLEGPESILGRSVIVHERADDFTTQPTGDAGGRVACGVIGIAHK